MKAINHVIVKIDNTYLNNITTKGGNSLIINNSIETVSSINRVSEVVACPNFVKLQEGDKIISHHNIFRYRNGMSGKLVPSSFWIKDNLFFIPLTEIFAFKRDDEWESFDPFVFVEPIKDESEKSIGKLSISDSMRSSNTHKGNIKQLGKVYYNNNSLKEMGVNKGDIIVFSPYSEYEFEIDDKILYKMKNTDITILLDEGVI